jgi:hypothetical protein
VRNLLFAAWAVGLLSPAVAQPPVQRPVVTHTDPNRPGFVVVKPQPAGGTPVGTVLEPARRQDPTPPAAAPRPGALRPAPIADDAAPLPAPTAPAAPEDGRLVLDAWDAVYLKGSERVGYFHVTVREYTRDGQKFLYATKTSKITVARFGQVIDQFSEDATQEMPDGTVLTTFMAQGIGKDQKLSLSGRVAGNKLTVTVTGAPGGTQQVPWPDGVLGVAKEATLLADRKPKVGDTIDYLCYEGRLNRVVKLSANVEKERTVSLALGEPARRVLQVRVGMEPIGDFQMPPSTLYVDPVTFEPLRMETDMPMLGGKVISMRTTKEVALAPVGKVPDLFDVQSIPLDKTIPNVHGQGAVVYRATANGTAPLEKLFAADGRQAIVATNPAGKSIDLRVSAATPAEANPVPPPDGCLSSSFFIDWNNDAVKQRAQAAAAGLPVTASALDKAKAVERWVHQNMRSTEFSQAMASCSNVAQSLSGDCTEYAMLAAGMCRALGVPSRTAIGLVYAPDKGGKPFLAYHMWFEAWTGDRWLPLDATLGRGGVGPGHVRITSADWHEERSFAPLLPVLTVLGAGPRVEVVRVEGPAGK